MQQLAPNGGASQAGSTLPPGALDQPGAITGLMNGGALMPVHQAALCGVGGMSVVTPIGTMYPLAVGPGGVILPAKEMYMREKLLGALNLERLQEQSECTRTEMARLRQELETANILKREELENASKKRTLESACRELREIVELQASIEAGQEDKQHSKGQTPRHGNISAGACNGEVSVHTMERMNNGNFQRAYGRGVEVHSILAASALKKGLYAMTVEKIKGLDITLPLGELTLDIEEYQLHEDSDGYVLRAVRQKLHRNIDMSQQGKESLVILLSQSVNFFLEDHYDAHVFVIELLHRKRVIAWASVTAVESGIWESVLRRPPVDVSNSLYFTNDCLDSTLIGGKITRLRSGVSREINNYIKDPEPDGSPPVSEGPAGYPYRRSSCVPNIIYNSYECAERLPVISSHIGNAIKGTTNTAHSRGYAYLSPTTSTMTSGERTFGASQTNSEYCLPSILSNNYTPSAHAFRTQNFGIAMVNDQMGLQQSQGIMQRGNAVSPNASGTRYPDVSLVGSAMVNDQMGLQQSQGILQRGNAVSPNSGGAKYLPSLSDEDELSPLKDCSPVVLPVSGPTRASKAPVCAPSGELPSTRSDAEKDALVTSVDGTTLPPPPTLLQTHKPRGIPDAPNASTGGELFLDLKFDRDGRAIVPVNYKRGVYYPPKLLIGLEEDSSTDVGVMLGFRSASDNFVPTQVAVQQKSAPVVNLKIIGVSGLPYNSACARIVVYLLNYIDFRTSQETNKRNDPHIFLRPPASVIYQSVNEDNNMLLNIYVDLHGIIVTDDTCALVVIEYITAPEADITVFGHACLPIGKKALAGNFLSRVRCGDPRQPWARTCVSHSEEDSASFARRRELNFTQEEAESILDAEALFIKAFSPPSSRIECIPCSFLSWTLNSDPNGPYFEFPGEPRMSNGEALLFSVRFALKVGAPKTEDEMGTLIQAFGNEKDVLPYSFTYAAPYDPRRGLFIRTDMLYGMGPSNALYTVVTALDAGERRIFFCTRKFHFTSDVGLPQFDDSVNVTTKILPLQQTMAVYHILRICNLETIREYGETRLTVEQIGWSVLKLFPESGVLRNGRYALAIFDGKPPENLFRRLKERPMETTFRELIASREIRYLKPCATVVVDVGDPLFIGQITVKHPGRPETTKLMTSAALAAQYPSAGNSGSVGQEQQMMLRNMGLDPEKVQSAVNIATRGFVEQNMLTKEIAATLDKRSSGHKRRNK